MRTWNAQVCVQRFTFPFSIEYVPGETVEEMASRVQQQIIDIIRTMKPDFDIDLKSIEVKDTERG